MLSCLRYGDINYFAACFLTVTGRRGNAYAYSSRVYDDISTSASAYVRGRDYASNSTPPGRRYGTNFSSDHHCFRRSVQRVQRHLRRAERASSIAHRHSRLRFYFAAHRLRRCRANETPRTGIGVINELFQQRTGIGVTAPITPRTGIGLPPRTAGSTIAFPKAVSAYAGLYPRIWTTTTILRLILLTTRIDVATTPTVFSSPFRTTSSAFRTTRASATFIVVRMPFKADNREYPPSFIRHSSLCTLSADAG